MKGAINVEWLGKKTINMLKGKTRADWQSHSILMLILMIPFFILYPPCHYKSTVPLLKITHFHLRWFTVHRGCECQRNKIFLLIHVRWCGTMPQSVHTPFGMWQLSRWICVKPHCHRVFAKIRGPEHWNKNDLYFKWALTGGERSTAASPRPLLLLYVHVTFLFLFYCLK